MAEHRRRRGGRNRERGCGLRLRAAEQCEKMAATASAIAPVARRHSVRSAGHVRKSFSRSACANAIRHCRPFGFTERPSPDDLCRELIFVTERHGARPQRSEACCGIRCELHGTCQSGHIFLNDIQNTDEQDSSMSIRPLRGLSITSVSELVVQRRGWPEQVRP